MEITVTINNCHDCRHLDHSGSYTPGGAKWICGHPYAVNAVTKAKKLHIYSKEEMVKVNDPKTPEQERDKLLDRWHWKHRVLPDEGKTIPDWCPLKQRKPY